MKALISLSLAVAYISAVVFGSPAAGPRLSEWFLLITSVLFVWAYLALADGRALVPLALVVASTLVLPMTVLVWIGLPTHHTWWASLQAVLQFFREYGPPWGLQILFPVIGAVGTAVITERIKQARAARGADHAL